MPGFPTTANIADACLSLTVEFGVWPDLRAVGAPRMAGPAYPARHSGSVDVFLEAIGNAPAGAILMADNDGRRDEGCVGDLVVREAKLAGLGGIAIWGCHRDTAELQQIGFPVFSLGSFPVGPREMREPPAERFAWAQFGDFLVSPAHYIVADQDGVIALDAADWPQIRAEAEAIAEREGEQARRVEEGESLRAQFRFDEFLKQRERDPGLSFRAHLRKVGGEIER